VFGPFGLEHLEVRFDGREFGAAVPHTGLSHHRRSGARR
jgi:hypothetical protein